MSPCVRTVLITKGDLVHQTRKVTTSGIEHHFQHIRVVLEHDGEFAELSSIRELVDWLDG